MKLYPSSTIPEHAPVPAVNAATILYHAYSYLAKAYVAIPQELAAELGEDYLQGMVTIHEYYEIARAENATERYFKTRRRPVPFKPRG
jgi:hypothetical protein